MKPQAPCIIDYKVFFDHVLDISAFNSVSSYQFNARQTEEEVVYDSAGNKWTYTLSSSSHKRALWKKWVAYWFWNKTIEVDVEWHYKGTYDLSELKQVIIKYIKLDDDILTQFIEEKDLISKVNETQSFQELLDCLYKYVYEPDEDAISEEFGYMEE